MHSDNSPLKQKVRATLRRYGMLDGTNPRLLVAYSGGADSSALLYILREIAAEDGFEVAAAHVDHMIRGEEAERDREFCESTCERLGVKLHVLKEDVPKFSRDNKLSLEEGARVVRYRFFESLMEEFSYSATATAHHASDNAETALFNLIRGTSPDGMGIPPVRGRYIRPLLEVKKSELEDYCRRNAVAYVTDSTNADTEYTRNFIRHVLIPECEKINPLALDAITRFTAITRADTEYLNAEAAKIPVDASPDALSELPMSILSRYVRRLYRSVAPDNCELTFEQTEEVCGFIREKNLNRGISLPGNVTFTLRRGGVKFTRGDVENVEFSHELFEGLTTIPEIGDAVFLHFSHGDHIADETAEKDIKHLKNIYRLFIHKTLNSDKIIKGLFVRSRQPGDKLRIGGMSRSIKNLCRKNDLGTENVARLPFFVSGDEVIYVPMLGVADGYKAEKSTECVEVYYFTDNNVTFKENTENEK